MQWYMKEKVWGVIILSVEDKVQPKVGQATRSKLYELRSSQGFKEGVTSLRSYDSLLVVVYLLEINKLRQKLSKVLLETTIRKIGTQLQSAATADQCFLQYKISSFIGSSTILNKNKGSLSGTHL